LGEAGDGSESSHDARPGSVLPSGSGGATGYGSGSSEKDSGQSGGGDSLGSINSSGLALQERAIMEHLRRYLDYPSRARANGWEGKVAVFFRLGLDGRARDIRVAASSGFSVLDRSAMAAVRRASPFSPPPSREVALTLPVTYSLR
jgi:protein TonB